MKEVRQVEHPALVMRSQPRLYISEVTKWTFGCDGWMIGDGTYTHIEVGRVLEASIEFWLIGRLEVIEPTTTTIEPKGQHRYRVAASVVELAEFAVLDLGDFLATCHASPMTQLDSLSAGDFVEGTVGLGLNPFDWRPEAFPQRKRWIVDTITRTMHARARSGQAPAKDEIEQVQVLNNETVDHDAAYYIECRLVAVD